MKVVFFGTPNFAIPTLERILEHSSFEVLAAVTQPDKRRGRGNQTTASPIKSAALARQIPVFSPPRIKRDAETLKQLRDLDADIFVVIAYGQILSQEILDMPRLGCINVHGSILPKYRGAAPINWCLYHGETQTGITTMLMDAGLDTGAMLLKATISIELTDNAQEIADILADLGANLLVETLVKWERQEIIPIPQDYAEATYAPLIHKSDYVLDWSKSAIALHNQARGFFPNCTTTFRGQLLKILATIPLDTTDSVQLLNLGAPGTVVGIVKGMGVAIETGAGILLLKELQLPGKKPQSGGDFVNGNRLMVGEVLGH